MTAMTTIPHGRPFTVADLEAMPDDGNRYELIDGMLLVSPSPNIAHQKVVVELATLLNVVRPGNLHVFVAPTAVRPSTTTELQPDVLVARHEDLTEKLLSVAPLLVVEVLSPSSVINDLNNKKAAYERIGVADYWVIDPQQPTLIVFELDAAGKYQQVAEVKGDEVFEARRPFAVRVVPVELLGTLAG